MDFDEDMHLCMRCGQTVAGLDNYVTHRQQLCYRFQQPYHSVFLPTPPELPNEPQVPELPSVANDIYKLSASDFFLSLNLQSISKHSDSCVEEVAEIRKSVDSDLLCSKLSGISSIESALECSFPDVDDDKTIGCDVVSDLPALSGNDYVDLDSVIFPGENWEDFGAEKHDLCNGESSDCSKSFKSEHSSPASDVCVKNGKEQLNLEHANSNAAKSKKKKKTLKEYAYTNFSTLNVPRTSYRQKLCANDSMVCCQRKPTTFSCSFCGKTYIFEATYVDHLLVCKDPKKSGTKEWEIEVFQNERHLIVSSHFKCLLCSFYCNESFAFLNHLKSAGHRQNAASLKKPLICIICQDECSASDEMKEHFSRCHLQYSGTDHPVSVAEKKKNLHCCYCFTLLRTASALNESSSLQEEDKIYIKRGLQNTTLCSYGVDKHKFKLSMAKVNSLIVSEASTPSGDLASSIVDTECLVSSERCSDQESSASKERESVSEELELSVQEESLPRPSPEKRLVAKITTKNGKLIYKKLKPSKSMWTCKTCRMKFHSRFALESHSKECSDTVSTCSLRMKITLRKRNRNSGVTSFLCDRCTYIGKSFNQLTRHFRTHSGEKPFLCKHCNCTFSLSSQLIRHTRLHTGKKPYKCPYCSYRSNTQENMRKHILKTKKHRGKAMYPCEHCEFETNEFNGYKVHLHAAHSITYPSGVSPDQPVNFKENP